MGCGDGVCDDDVMGMCGGVNDVVVGRRDVGDVVEYGFEEDGGDVKGVCGGDEGFWDGEKGEGVDGVDVRYDVEFDGVVVDVGDE